MDQHTIEIIGAALTGPAALAMWSGAGKVLGAIARRRAEAAAKRTEAEGTALVIDAETRRERLRADDTAQLRLVATLEERVARAESRLDTCEQRHLDSERRNDECEERVGDLRADNAGLVGRVDTLTAELTAVSRRLDSLTPQPMPKVSP